jgi:hypothetical protein
MRRFLGYGEIQLLNWRNRHAQGIFYCLRKGKWPAPENSYEIWVRGWIQRTILQISPRALTGAESSRLLDGGYQ